MATIPIEPMRVGEILDRSFFLTPGLLRALWVIILIVAAFSTGVTYLNLQAQHQDDIKGFVYLALLFPLSIIHWLVNSYFYLIITFSASDCWLGEDFSAGRAWPRCTFGLVFRSLVLGLRIGATTALLCLLLIIPGLVYFVNRIPAFYILILEGRGTADSLSRAKELMTHHPGIPWYSFRTPMMRISGIMLVTMVLSFLPGLITGVGMGFDMIRNGGKALSTFNLIILFFSQALTMCCAIFNTLALLGFYYDLRLRNEGLDLEHEITQILETPTH